MIAPAGALTGFVQVYVVPAGTKFPPPFIGATVKVPLLHIVDAVAEEIRRVGLDNVSLLGTRFTMEAAFFSERLKKFGITAVTPGKSDRDWIHGTIFGELGKNIFLPETKQRYKEAYHSLHEALKLVKPGSCADAFKHFGKGATARLPGFDGFHGVGLCIYESPWLRGGDPEKYMISLEENMIVALEINHYPVKLEHLLRVTADGAEILSHYPVEPELVPA